MTITNTTDHNVEKIYDKIVNKHDFNFTLNPEYQTCKSSQLFLLIYVHTAPVNFKRRLSIRETWARRSMFRDIRLVFMMGYTLDKKTTQLLTLESNLYQDLVQENFIDSYKNLTYKGIMAMKWISTYCQNAKFILKTDDDIITNPFILLRHLKSLNNHGLIAPKSLMCLVWNRMKPMRDKKSKWYLSRHDFENDYYAQYCSGSAFVLIYLFQLIYILFDTSFFLDSNQ
jgi:beta-1,3-galactosyltransferase 1